MGCVGCYQAQRGRTGRSTNPAQYDQEQVPRNPWVSDGWENKLLVLGGQS